MGIFKDIDDEFEGIESSTVASGSAWRLSIE